MEVENFYPKEYLNRHTKKIGNLLYSQTRWMSANQVIMDGDPNNTLPLEINATIPVVDGRSPIGRAIIRFVHEKYCHLGVDRTHLKLLQGVFICKPKESISKVVRSCYTCKLKLKKLCETKLGSLASHSLHFSSVMFLSFIDVSGPYLIRSSNLKGTRGRPSHTKCWALHLSCSMSNVSFISVLEAYDTAAFIQALHKIACIVGMPSIAMIDGSATEAKGLSSNHFLLGSEYEIYKETGVEIRISGVGGQSHSRIGRIERHIGLVKKYLELQKTQISNLTASGFDSVLFQASMFLNSLPMATSGRFSQTASKNFVCPLNFMGRFNTSRMPVDISELEGLDPRVALSKIKEATKGMLSFFINSLPDLLLRPTRHDQTLTLPQKGDVVLFQKLSSQLKPTWHLGRIKDLEKGSDGTPRIYSIEYTNHAEIFYPLNNEDKMGKRKPTVIKQTTRRSTDTICIIYNYADESLHEEFRDLLRLLKEKA